MTNMDSIAERLGVSKHMVKDLMKQLDPGTVISVIEYIEHRIDTMVGDESPKLELKQIRRDLGAMSVFRVLHAKNTHENI